jgi:hypothetical protein
LTEVAVVSLIGEDVFDSGKNFCLIDCGVIFFLLLSTKCHGSIVLSYPKLLKSAIFRCGQIVFLGEPCHEKYFYYICKLKSFLKCPIVDTLFINSFNGQTIIETMNNVHMIMV